MQKPDLVGKRFGKLVVVEHLDSRKEGDRRVGFWLCKCDCGKFIEERTTHLTNGRRCGCSECQRGLPKGEAAFNAIFSAYKHKAKIGDREFSLTKEQFKKLTKENCVYYGIEPSNNYSPQTTKGGYIYNGVDRINNIKGYTIDNCVPCCVVCNWMKSNRTIVDFLNHVEIIHKHQVSGMV